jgi:hypothetical protein
MTNPTSAIGEKKTQTGDSGERDAGPVREKRTSPAGTNYRDRNASSTRILKKSEVVPIAKKALSREERREYPQKPIIHVEDLTLRPREIISSPSSSPSSSSLSSPPSSPSSASHRTKRRPQTQTNAESIQQRMDISDLSFSLSFEENENLQKNHELIPTNFKAPNHVNPEFKKLISLKIEEHKKYQQLFIDALERPYLEDQIESEKQNKEIEIARNNMMHSADNVVWLVSKNKTIDTIDFLQDLTLIVQMSDLLRPKFIVQKSDLLWSKIGKQNPLEDANRNLKSLLLINFANCRHDTRVKEVLGLHKKHLLFSGISSGINGDLEREKRKIMILCKYRTTMLQLATNLEFTGRNLKSPELDPKSNQSILLAKIDLHLDEIFRIVDKHDRGREELKKILPEDDRRTYEKIIYTSIAQMIRGQVIDKFWVEEYIKTEKKLIQLRSDEQRSALFCNDCLEKFDKFLDEQKCDLDFLVQMKRVVGKGMAFYINKNRDVILNARTIPEPDDPTKEKLEAYNKELEDYEQASMSLLSEKVFDGDKTYLPSFFMTSIKLIQKWMPKLLMKSDISKDDQSPPGVDQLEIHAAIFSFLGILQKPTRENPQPLIDKILDEFNEELSSSNKETLEKLKEMARINKRNDLPIKMTIDLLLHFYRGFDHKIIMVPVANLTEMYQLMHPDPERKSILKKDLEKEPEKRIYICPMDMGFVNENVRVDEIDLGLDPHLGNHEDGTLRLLLNTCTTVSWDYASDAVSKNAKESKKNAKEFKSSIEFSYQIVKPKIPLSERIKEIERAKGLSEEAKEKEIEEAKEIDREIEKAKEERIKLFTLLIEAADFPRFGERYW